MTRPTRITVNAGDNSWESQLNTNLQQLYDRPLPPLLHAGTLANLESTRPAAQYQWCIAVVDYDGAGTPGEHLAFSNGTAWKLASNWEFIHRRTFRSTAGAIAVADIDDTIITTGAASFAVTLPAIADANEGRVVRFKHNGTGTITWTPTGGDTIDGAATKVIDTQYEPAEFVSDGTSNWITTGGGGGTLIFTGLTDTPANYAAAGLKLVRVNSTPDALEFVTPTFLLGTDTPANYAGAGSKLVRVNSTPDALEFVDPTFLLGTDTPANYTGAAGKFVKVNSTPDGLEFVESLGEVGQRLKHLTRGHLAADADQTINSTPTVITLPTEMSSAGTAITYDAINDEMDINEDGTYIIMAQVTSDDASPHNIVMWVELDTGGGFNPIEETTSFQGNAVRSQNFAQTIRTLAAGDKLRLISRDLSSVAPVAREGTNMTVIKMEVALGAGGDMECFQQGLDASETFALSSGAMAVVDLQSNIINNATNLYTFTAGTDVVAVSEAGFYWISYTITADDTTPTLTTAAELQVDTGGGFATIDGSQSNGGGADKFSHGNSVLIELAVDDEIRLRAQDITGDGNCIAGTMLRLVRLKRGSDSIDYSTTAEKTGRKWIDGKDIWRKCIAITAAIPAATVTSYAHSIASLDRFVHFEGYCTRDDATTGNYPLNYAQSGAETLMNVDDTNIVIFINAAYTGAGSTLSDPFFILEYTI